jgi:Rps23 Pro-64 3,4-dihydroxylase Tpa1-like proline 4-hydroxylase
VADEAGKLYDVDFWMHPDGDVLTIHDTKVHKEPRKSLLYGWYKYPRYTFVNDQVVTLY